jgi:hypothetical protein
MSLWQHSWRKSRQRNSECGSQTSIDVSSETIAISHHRELHGVIAADHADSPYLQDQQLFSKLAPERL